MTGKKLSNEFMDKILMDSAWKTLSEVNQWTEQWLEKYKDKVDWNEISSNDNIRWTLSMLEKFKKLVDWKELSATLGPTILTEDVIERFKDYWDWTALSNNMHIELDFQLIDKFVDCWDWAVLIDRSYEDDKLYSFEFFEKYIDHIPSDKLQNSRLWSNLSNERAREILREIIA